MKTHLGQDETWLHAQKLGARLALPRDLAGKSVLEIGCAAGLDAIEAKRRGATRTLCIDTDARLLDDARRAAELCGFDIEFLRLDVYEIAALREHFDLVLFADMIHRLRYPLLALDLLREHVVADLMVFQSMLRGSERVAAFEEDYALADRAHFERPEYPRLHFVEHRYAHERGYWWLPNKGCVEAMLRSAGFQIVENPASEVYLCRRAEVPWIGRPSRHVWIRSTLPRAT